MSRLPLMLVRGVALVLALTSGALAQQPAAQSAPQPTDTPASAPSNFFGRFFRAYVDEFKLSADNEPEPPRRALPSPWDAPPFPASEYQGFPLVGVPYGTKEYALMKALSGTTVGDFLKD